MKEIIKTADGRIIVKRVCSAPEHQRPRIPAPRDLRVLFAYGEKCLANPNIEKDHNPITLARAAGSKNPMAAGYFTEVFE